MPPKAKLHKDKGKIKVLPKPKPNEPNTSNETAQLSEEVQRQNEVELCWCIQQLQNALSSGKLNPKQTQDTTKTLNTLMSNSAPLIKKKQLMRLTFGDYRAKMAEEEKKFNKVNHQIKLTVGKPSERSVFVKKAPFLSSDKNFQFNFNIAPEDQTAEDISKLNIANDDVKVKESTVLPSFHYQPSDNNFKFNFMSDNV